LPRASASITRAPVSKFFTAVFRPFHAGQFSCSPTTTMPYARLRGIFHGPIACCRRHFIVEIFYTLKIHLLTKRMLYQYVFIDVYQTCGQTSSPCSHRMAINAVRKFLQSFPKITPSGPFGVRGLARFGGYAREGRGARWLTRHMARELLISIRRTGLRTAKSQAPTPFHAVLGDPINDGEWS
jgi:hypothetical protein